MNLTTSTSKGLFASLCLATSLFAQALVESREGVFAMERWKNMQAGYDVNELVLDPQFYDAPSVQDFRGARVTNMSPYVGGRSRGYITAPETGNYTFWVSAKASGQIWLSTDETKYRKELIAYLGADSGGGTAGVWSTSNNLWDQYASQMSEEVYLEAGQKYYFEALVKAGHGNYCHVSLAWATPSADRALIPSSVITSYVLESEDADDDFLPDDWETLYGLDTNDNGLFDLARQGERGDFDQDGLNNRLEYVLGLDPTDADSDSDGLTDGEEYFNYQTDPAVSDAPGEQVVAQVDVGSFLSNSGLTWLDTGSGYVSSSFRGETAWNFDVPHDGYWVIHINTQLRGDLYLTEKIDFDYSFDEGNETTKTLTYGNNGFGVLRIVTPYLTAGSHQFNLDIDNLVARRSVSILSIDLLEPTGADLDQDGVVDWVISAVQDANHVRPYQSASRTSPAFIEGVAEDRSAVLVDGATPETGVDGNHWYADIALSADVPMGFQVDLTSQLSHSGNIEWASTNVLETSTSTLAIRKGDALKLVAHPASGATGQATEITLPGINLARLPGAIATQSDPYQNFWYITPATYAVDGNRDGEWANNSTSFTLSDTVNNLPWWQVDFQASQEIASVKIWGRTESAQIQKRLSNYRVSILDASGGVVISKDFHTQDTYTQDTEEWVLATPVTGQTVRIQKLGKAIDGSLTMGLSEVEVFSAPQTITLASDSEYVTHAFNTAGTQQVSATHSDGTSAILTVEVKDVLHANPTPRDYVNNVNGNLVYSTRLVDSTLSVDGGESVTVTKLNNASHTLKVVSQDRGEQNILWRLYEEGPVLGKQALNFIGFSDAAQNDVTSTFFSRDFVGYNEVTTPIVLTDLPSDSVIVVSIYRNGVTFLDGTKRRTLTPADFDNGVHILRFLFPIGMSGGYCHYISVYDRNGNLIVTR